MSFLASHKGLLLKTLWPRRLSGVGKVTGIATFLSDAANFITDKAISPVLLFVTSVVVFVFFLSRLWPQIRQEELPITNEKIDLFYDDKGENTRFIFLVMTGFMITWISFTAVGPESISEKILKKLNIIEDKIENVQDTINNIEELLQAGTTVIDPNTPEEYYVNALFQQATNSSQSWEDIQTIYDRFGVGKMDSAEMFLRLGRQTLGTTKTRNLMQSYYDEHGDPALLYYLNISIRDPEERRTAFIKMRETFPEYPPSYLEHDVLGSGTKWWQGTSFTNEEKHLRFIEDKRIIDLFLTKIDDFPPSNYYYGYAPNWESNALSAQTLVTIQIQSEKQRMDNTKAREEMRSARRLKTETAEKARLDALDVKPQISDWVFNKGQGRWVINEGVSSKVMDGTGDFLHLFLESAPRGFTSGKAFRYQFEGHDMVEVRRMPKLFEKVPAKGVFTLNWQDRDGNWHGPFTYPYDGQKAP
ncbi:MAG: hypothetical protein JKY84_12565 [Emcibacteraceae bacterium]|nr:hypothetical protein [Emcibacteraceae bacterium]